MSRLRVCPLFSSDVNPSVGEYREDDLLPISALQHLVFCPRRVALIFLEGVWSDNEFTIDGLQRHETVHDEGFRSSKGVRMLRGVPLRSLTLGVVGFADVVEMTGERAKMKLFPVEYKRGRLRHERGYEVQLCAQAICLEESLGVPVRSGALFFWETRRRLTIELDSQLRAETEAAARELHRVLSEEKTPPAVPGRRCAKCSLVELCVPRVWQRRRQAGDYVRHLATDDPIA